MTLEHSLDIKITDRYQCYIFDIQDLKICMVYHELSDFEKTLLLLIECIESVTSGEEVISRIDMTQDEIVEFVDSLIKTNRNVIKFFETMPK
jgi:hypothetical protein